MYVKKKILVKGIRRSNKILVSKETVVTRRWEIEQKFILSNELIKVE